MDRVYIDCREFPSESHCSLAISADDEAELLEAAVRHAKDVHGHEDTPEFRQELRRTFKHGAPVQ